MHKYIVLLILTMMLTEATAFAGAEPTAAVKAQNREVLKMAAAEMSKKLPQKIDDYTALVAVEQKNQTLIYIYEINTGAKSDEAVRTDDRPRMENAITKGSCQSSRVFLDSGIALTYIYNNAATKKEMFRFDIDSERCKTAGYDY